MVPTPIFFLIPSNYYDCLWTLFRHKDLEHGSYWIKVDKSGKIFVNEAEGTSVPRIFAIGDCTLGRSELTPPAITVCMFYIYLLFFENFINLKEDSNINLGRESSSNKTIGRLKKDEGLC